MDPTQKTSATRRTRTSVSRSAPSLLTDARDAIALVRKHRADFDARDRGAPRPLVTDAVIEAWDRDLEEAERATVLSRMHATERLRHAAEDKTTREALHSALCDLRNDLCLRLPDHPRLADAFGCDPVPRRDSTMRLREAAGHAVGAWERWADRALLEEAGVTAPRMLGIERLRRKSERILGERRVAHTQGGAYASVKVEALRKVRANTAFIRAIARAVFHDRPEVARSFRSLLPRRAAVRRDRRPPGADARAANG